MVQEAVGGLDTNTRVKLMGDFKSRMMTHPLFRKFTQVLYNIREPQNKRNERENRVNGFAETLYQFIESNTDKLNGQLRLNKDQRDNLDFLYKVDRLIYRLINLKLLDMMLLGKKL